MFVDIDPGHSDTVVKLLENRLDRPARTAPGRPEVDDERISRNRLVERRSVELPHLRAIVAAYYPGRNAPGRRGSRRGRDAPRAGGRRSADRLERERVPCDPGVLGDAALSLRRS